MADILSISSGAVGVYQRVLGVTSNNIANVGNENYVKQDASVGQTPPTFDGRNFLGTGAMFQGVQRQYNAFIETSLRNASANLASQESLVSYANRVIDVLGSGEIGLSPALDRFFSAARTVAADPASPVARATFLRETEGVAARFRDLSSQMQLVESETRLAMNGDLAEVNSLATQLGKVNLELSRNRSLERQPSALLDERDAILRQLSAKLDVQVSEAENGVVTVSVGGAGSSGALVAGQVVKPLEATFDVQAPERLTILLDPYGREPVSIAGVTGGAFGGLIALRSQILEPALSNLDLLAKTFMGEVNRIHTEGVDAYGDLGKPLLDIKTSFNFERILGTAPLNVEARVTDLAAFDGKDIRLSFDAEAGQVYGADLLGPFAVGDRIEVLLNGVGKIFEVTSDPSPDAVAGQLRQFIDGAFGVQLRSQVDPAGRVLVNSSVMKSFAFDIRVSSDSGRVQLDQSQGLWVAENRAGQKVTGLNSLTVDGVTVNVQGAAVNGEQLIVRASSRPAAGLVTVQDDANRVAAAASFRATRSNSNTSTVKATVRDLINEPAAQAAPLLGSTNGIQNNPVVSEAIDWVAQRVVPLATVAAGQRDVVVYLDPGASTADLQVLTRDGRHLLGSAQADGASFIGNVTNLPAPFNPGSTYSSAYLNKTGQDAYRDLSMFYGARATALSRDVLGVDHVPVDREVLPATLRADHAPPGGLVEIPANGLTVNGVTLPAWSAQVSTAQDAADLLNTLMAGARESGSEADLQALEGLVARVQDGLLEVTRVVDVGSPQALEPIALGLGAQGNTRLLAQLGFRTAAYLDGVVPEDLLVFTSGAGDVKIGATFAGEPFDASAMRASARVAPLEVRFDTADRYRIVDVVTNTVVAERRYLADDTIRIGGLEMAFSSPPRAGDVFRIDGNQDGTGDNGNALRMADLETEGVTGPGRSVNLGDAYLAVIDRLANVTQQAQVAVKALEVVKQQAVEARESVSGVSLDEEAANLIRFQQAYQAAAKSMQVASQMFDAVLRI
jgi:flagellar hook-associated protein FlgK